MTKHLAEVQSHATYTYIITYINISFQEYLDIPILFRTACLLPYAVMRGWQGANQSFSVSPMSGVIPRGGSQGVEASGRLLATPPL